MRVALKQAPDYISTLRKDFAKAQACFPGTEVTVLAQQLMEGAVRYDLDKAMNLSIHWRYKNIVRDAAQPPEFEHPEIAGMDWADAPVNPLAAAQESWNAGRRATATGQPYDQDAQGRPVNPYMNTGINGRGLLGQFGPNHAVDSGLPILIKRDTQTGQKTLFMLGITRKFDQNAPALAGGFAKYPAGGSYIMDQAAIVQTQTEEFFEEMISGSVILLPEFADLIDVRFNTMIAGIEGARGSTIDTDHRDEIHEQVTTALKMEQVQKYDPDFLQRLKNHIAKGHECFAGPVLCDPRSTNNAWIESHLTWSSFDEQDWESIKGDDKFGYRLDGGDDASSVVYHKFGAAIVRNAYASHGVMMTFMAASYLLKTQDENQTIDSAILSQCREVADLFLGQPKP